MVNTKTEYYPFPVNKYSVLCFCIENASVAISRDTSISMVQRYDKNWNIQNYSILFLFNCLIYSCFTFSKTDFDRLDFT